MRDYWLVYRVQSLGLSKESLFSIWKLSLDNKVIIVRSIDRQATRLEY